MRFPPHNVTMPQILIRYEKICPNGKWFDTTFFNCFGGWYRKTATMSCVYFCTVKDNVYTVRRMDWNTGVIKSVAHKIESAETAVGVAMAYAERKA